MPKTLTSGTLNAVARKLIAQGEIEKDTSLELIQSHANLYSDVHVVRASERSRNGRVFYVKIPHTEPGHEEIVSWRLQREFEALEYLRDELQEDENLNVVRPIVLWLIHVLSLPRRPQETTWRRSSRIMVDYWRAELSHSKKSKNCLKMLAGG